MGWEIKDLELDVGGQLANAFNFELQVTTDAGVLAGALRGDGIVLRSGRVRFNREDELRRRMEAQGLDAAVVIAQVSDHAARQSRFSTPVAS